MKNMGLCLCLCKFVLLCKIFIGLDPGKTMPMMQTSEAWQWFGLLDNN